MPLFGQDQPNIGTGWARLGAAFAPPDPEIYARQLLLGYQGKRAKYDADKAMEEAHIAQSMRIARAQMNEANMGAAGYDARQVPFLNAVLGANASPSITQLGVLAAPGAGAGYLGAADAMQRGDFAGYNQSNALGTSSPYQPVQEVGGEFIANGATLGQLGAPGARLPTFGTASTIATQRAAAEASLAKAAKERAHASLYATQNASGGWNPNTGKRLPAAEAQILADSRAMILAGSTPEREARALTIRGYPALAKKLFQPPAGLGLFADEEEPSSTYAPLGSPGASAREPDVVFMDPSGTMPPGPPPPLKVGIVHLGYRYIGGPPSSPASWVKL